MEEHGRAVVVLDGNKLVGAVQILALGHGEGQRSALVAGPFHLVYVPVRAKQGGVHHADIRTDSLHLLGVPQREGVVVSVSDEEAVGAHGIEVVGRHLNGGITV